MTNVPVSAPPILSLDIVQQIDIGSNADQVFQSLVKQLTTDFSTPDNKPLPLVLEVWPGGRWFRDLGQGQGHLWGFVQVIKPPTLLEICGPLFMSFAANSHIQYRLTPASGGTQLTMRHRAFGMFDEQLRDGVHAGWTALLQCVKDKCS